MCSIFGVVCPDRRVDVNLLGSASTSLEHRAESRSIGRTHMAANTIFGDNSICLGQHSAK